MKAFVSPAGIAAFAILFYAGTSWAQNAPATLTDRVQKALNAVPGYGVFDYLGCKSAADGKVVLTGAVTAAHIDLKSQAAEAVRGLPGVTSVENNIEVLPANKDDDAVRKSVSAVVYENSSIYATTHSIHIIVKNLEVTLEGTVNSDIDRTMIGSAAVGAGNVFSVTNHLVATAADSADAQWRKDMAGGPLPPPLVISPSVSPNADKN